jgi:TPP-dependent indolepyruvate ferredoxin oxidoreductase alpha subunit
VTGRAAQRGQDLTILTGTHFMNGDEACAEGGVAAGCAFFAGYPITPATEVAERMARRLPQVGGVYIRRFLCRSQGHDFYFRTGFFPDDGKRRVGRDA